MLPAMLGLRRRIQEPTVSLQDYPLKFSIYFAPEGKGGSPLSALTKTAEPT